MMLRRVVYISQSRVGDDRSALDAIVEVSSARNAADGITGMLWS
ncbi:MAG: blue light sensor protein, partial [Oxalobacteraceae bacterium]